MDLTDSMFAQMDYNEYLSDLLDEEHKRPGQGLQRLSSISTPIMPASNSQEISFEAGPSSGPGPSLRIFVGDVRIEVFNTSGQASVKRAGGESVSPEACGMRRRVGTPPKLVARPVLPGSLVGMRRGFICHRL